MKKLILFAGLLFCSLTQAQTITATGNGQPISEGQTFTFNTLSQATSELDLLVTNVSNSPINVKLKVNQITNNSGGTNVQFCFGEQCFFQIAPNSTVPSNASGVTLQPGENNNENDHFWNNFAGNDTSAPVSYNLSFITVDDAGNQTGTLLTFNYIYSATAGTTDFTSLKNIGITVNNTVIKDNLTVTTTQKAKMEVYNITGQVVKTVAVQTGTQAINMSDLSAAPYIVRFTNDKNQASQIKVVKQ